jgi:hypothetical protein
MGAANVSSKLAFQVFSHSCSEKVLLLAIPTWGSFPLMMSFIFKIMNDVTGYSIIAIQEAP